MPDKHTGAYGREVWGRLGSYLDDYIRLCTLTAGASAGSSAEEIKALEEYARLERILQSRITASAEVLQSLSPGGDALPIEIKEKIETAEAAAAELCQTLIKRKGDVGRQIAGIRKSTSASSSLRKPGSASGRYLNISI